MNHTDMFWFSRQLFHLFLLLFLFLRWFFRWHNSILLTEFVIFAKMAFCQHESNTRCRHSELKRRYSHADARTHELPEQTGKRIELLFQLLHLLSELDQSVRQRCRLSVRAQIFYKRRICGVGMWLSPKQINKPSVTFPLKFKFADKVNFLAWIRRFSEVQAYAFSHWHCTLKQTSFECQEKYSNLMNIYKQSIPLFSTAMNTSPLGPWKIRSM